MKGRTGFGVHIVEPWIVLVVPTNTLGISFLTLPFAIQKHLCITDYKLYSLRNYNFDQPSIPHESNT